MARLGAPASMQKAKGLAKGR